MRTCVVSVFCFGRRGGGEEARSMGGMVSGDTGGGRPDCKGHSKPHVQTLRVSLTPRVGV